MGRVARSRGRDGVAARARCTPRLGQRPAVAGRHGRPRGRDGVAAHARHDGHAHPGRNEHHPHGHCRHLRSRGGHDVAGGAWGSGGRAHAGQPEMHPHVARCQQRSRGGDCVVGGARRGGGRAHAGERRSRRGWQPHQGDHSHVDRCQQRSRGGDGGLEGVRRGGRRAHSVLPGRHPDGGGRGQPSRGGAGVAGAERCRRRCPHPR